MSASGRDPSGPTVLEALFSERISTLRTPSRLLTGFVNFLVCVVFEESSVRSATWEPSKKLFGLKKFLYKDFIGAVFVFIAVFGLTEYVLLAVFGWDTVAVFSVFVPRGEGEIFLEGLFFNLFWIWRIVVRYLLPHACV